MTSAAELAARYDRYLAVLRARHAAGRPGRGLGGVLAFMAWIEGWWEDEAPPEPSGPPAAVSGVGGVGAVRWHETGAVILGYAPDLGGCYRVPADAAPPSLGPGARPASAGPRPFRPSPPR